MLSYFRVRRYLQNIPSCRFCSFDFTVWNCSFHCIVDCDTLGPYVKTLYKSGQNMKRYKSMHDITPCSWDIERCIIYRRSDVDSNKWYCRIRRDNGKYLIRSTKKLNQYDAMRVAKELYLELLMAERQNIIYGRNTFEHLWKLFIKKSSVSSVRKERFRSVGQRYFIAFFGAIDVALISSEVWEKYLNWRISYWSEKRKNGSKNIPSWVKEKPSERTLLLERQILRQFLHYCHDSGRLYTVPRLRVVVSDVEQSKNVNTSKTRGDAIPMKLMLSIEAKLRHHAFKSKDTNKSRNFARLKLYYYIKIMYHSLLRPIVSEMNDIKWSDIEVLPSDEVDGAFVAVIRVSDGKKGKRTAIMTYSGTKFLLEWRKICCGYSFGGEGDYVFPHYKTKGKTTTWHIGTQLRNRLKSYGMRKLPTGQNITLYSWRASAITNRIKAGWDVGRVSTAANTSIKAISESYYSEIMAAQRDRFANQFKDEAIVSDKDKKKVVALMSYIKKSLKK